MDFRLGADSDELRAEAREFLETFMTPEREEHLHRTGVSYDPDFTRELVERGWLAAGWPAEWGGGGRSRAEIGALVEEFQWFDAPNYAPNVTTMVAKVIHQVGSDEMKRDILPKAMAGEIIIVLGFSEPEAGSDVANAQCRAVRDGEEWVINGQKMFTTNAHIADYAFLLTRTNTDVAKHKGLTMFLVPLKDQEGFEAQAVYTLSGERTNITFFTDLRVPDSARIGDVDGGWRVMTVSLQEEHSAGFGARIARFVDAVETWATEAVGPDGRRRLDDPDVRGKLARAAAETEVPLLLQRRASWMAGEGMVPEAEGPMAKLYSSEAMERATQDISEVVGPDALRSYLDPSAPVDGRIEHALRFSLGTTIYAGTSEVQRNIIAQRGLGLPR
jgi:alkylation response protein AidB-like acyl-CoA dehydrogenase